MCFVDSINERGAHEKSDSSLIALSANEIESVLHLIKYCSYQLSLLLRNFLIAIDQRLPKNRSANTCVMKMKKSSHQ